MKSGIATLVGRPNVGKSTLLNQVVGTKVSIVSDRPQTTRNQVRGVWNGDGRQVVFIDTPGIHKPKTELGRRLNQRSIETLEAVDVVVFLIEATAAIGAGDRFIAGLLREIATPVILVVNKTDAAGPADILGQLAGAADTLGDFAAYVPLSALTGDGVEPLLSEITARLPEGPL
ncbi:MAG TPA: GTPase Era, partial [Acidimicrobiia bacterium]|nr:GTPase Era [Acidimicrobiia bacterium]